MSFVDYLCKKVNMAYSKLSDILSVGIGNYKVHKQRTKGKSRTVYQPSEFLKRLQTIAIKEVFSKYPVSPYSTAYEKGCSILDNAKVHKNSKFLVRYDIKDFFGSIKFWHFERMLSDKYEYSDIRLLWRICSLNDSLPVGSHSAPFIANRIMNTFDRDFARKFRNIKYTRYADDLICSSDNELPSELFRELENGLRDIRLTLNAKKTRSYNQKTPKKVTGVTVTADNNLTVGKRYKVAFKKQLYDYITKKKGNKKKIIGKLNYIRFIEPSYYAKLVIKYNLHNTLLKSDSFADSSRKTWQQTYSHNRDWHRRNEYQNTKTQPSKNGIGKGCYKPLLIIVLIVLAIIILSAALNFYFTKEREEQVSSIIELDEQNYTEYLTVNRGYDNYPPKTTFHVQVLNKSKYWIKDLSIDFCVMDGDTVIYKDTASFDLLATLPDKMYFDLDKVHPHFWSYEFIYTAISGTVTNQPKNSAYEHKNHFNSLNQLLANYFERVYQAE